MTLDTETKAVLLLFYRFVLCIEQVAERSHPPAFFEKMRNTSESGIFLFGYQYNNRRIIRMFELIELFGSVFVGSLKDLFIYSPIKCISKMYKSVILKHLLFWLKSIGERSPLHYRDLE